MSYLVKLYIGLDRTWDLFLGKFFDFAYGVETSKEVSVKDLVYFEKDIKHLRKYQAHPPTLLKKTLIDLSLNFSEYDFIDIGSGKGRALLLASQFPFRSIRGVDICPRLCSIAEKNRDEYQKKNKRYQGDILIQNENILDTKWGKGKKIFFLYNPFDGLILKQFLQTYIKTCPSLADDIFIYLNPLRGYLFSQLGIPEISSYPHPNSNKILKVFSQNELLKGIKR